jgi:integrase/recombinase XerD
MASLRSSRRAPDQLFLGVRPSWLHHRESDVWPGKIKVDQTPTDYFQPHEFDKVVDATYAYRENRGETGNSNSTRLRTSTLLMRWSGLRIRDAVTLERSRLHGDNLLLYQAKTGTPVYVPLPSHLVEALSDVPAGPKPNPRYIFWSGNGSPKSVVANWQRSNRRLFALSDITKPDGSPKRCHPHMFRDTFAVEMLLAGCRAIRFRSCSATPA